ncbi:MAG: hypothetical protein ABIJ84_00720 [bacterium]
MNSSRLFIIIVISLLVAGNVYLGIMLVLEKKELSEAREHLREQEVNEKSLFFASLFIDKVLLGEGEVSFEDRLKLENAVRDIGDKEIFDQWQGFVKSQSDKDVQVSVARMLNLLFDKVSD